MNLKQDVAPWLNLSADSAKRAKVHAEKGITYKTISMGTHNTMRVWHRYLGYFLTGIMAVYAISGIVMVFRETDFLKSEKQHIKQLKAGLKNEDIGPELKLKNLRIEGEEGTLVRFKNGSYDRKTGEARYTTMELPFVLDKMTKMHKATHKQPLYFLNIFFGLSLLFFVASSFWMFLPKTTIFRKGLYFALAGFLLTLLMVLF